MICNAPNLWKEKVTEDSDVTSSNIKRGTNLLTWPSDMFTWFYVLCAELLPSHCIVTRAVSAPAPHCSVCSGDTPTVPLLSAIVSHCRHQLTDTSVLCVSAPYPHFLFFSCVCLSFPFEYPVETLILEPRVEIIFVKIYFYKFGYSNKRYQIHRHVYLFISSLIM